MGPLDDTLDWTDNIVRKKKWLAVHDDDTIKIAENHRFGEWWECVRHGRQIAEANDLGTLMSILEADFK